MDSQVEHLRAVDELPRQSQVLAARRGDPRVALEADAWLAARWAEADDVDRGRFTYERALIAARLGERERALTLLRQAVGEGLPAIPYLYPEIEVDPDLDSLRSDPAFHRLLEPKG